APSVLAAPPEPTCTGTGTVTCTFPYVDQVTDGPYQWVVPAGVTSVVVTAEGAQGGGHQNVNPLNAPFFPVQAQGGRGARVTTTRAVTAGETLTVEVGAQGAPPDAGGSTNAFGGGGAAGNGTLSVVGGARGGGGGGATVVRRGSVLVVVAG